MMTMMLPIFAAKSHATQSTQAYTHTAQSREQCVCVVLANFVFSSLRPPHHHHPHQAPPHVNAGPPLQPHKKKTSAGSWAASTPR